MSWNKSLSRQRGFTLIEVLITVALVGIIAVVASPLTGSIMSGSRISEAEGVLNQAVGKAKAIALRNHMGAMSDAPVAAVCISNTNQLTVEQGDSGTSPSCSTGDGSIVWTAQMNSDVAIKTSESGAPSVVSCMCFSNKALLTSSSCSGCISNTNFQLSIGSQPPELVSIF